MSFEHWPSFFRIDTKIRFDNHGLFRILCSLRDNFLVKHDYLWLKESFAETSKIPL